MLLINSDKYTLVTIKYNYIYNLLQRRGYTVLPSWAVLSLRPSVRNNFSRILDAWNVNALFLKAYNMVGFIFVLIERHYQPKTLKQSGRKMMTPEACSTKQELASTRKNAPILKHKYWRVLESTCSYDHTSGFLCSSLYYNTAVSLI